MGLSESRFGVVLPRDTAQSLEEQNTTQRLALVQTAKGQEMAPWREDVSLERANGEVCREPGPAGIMAGLSFLVFSRGPGNPQDR